MHVIREHQNQWDRVGWGRDGGEQPAPLSLSACHMTDVSVARPPRPFVVRGAGGRRAGGWVGVSFSAAGREGKGFGVGLRRELGCTALVGCRAARVGCSRQAAWTSSKFPGVLSRRAPHRSRPRRFQHLTSPGPQNGCHRSARAHEVARPGPAPAPPPRKAGGASGRRAAGGSWRRRPVKLAAPPAAAVPFSEACSLPGARAEEEWARARQRRMPPRCLVRIWPRAR
jgi:hypothetical protein